MNLGILHFALLVGAAVIKAAPNCNQVQIMSSAISKGIRNLTTRGRLVRLGFHDCVGGCNGCINFNDPSNIGLEATVQILTQIYNSNNFVNFGVSRADFFALAATLAVRSAVDSSNRERNKTCASSVGPCEGPCPLPCFELQWGRPDASSCNDEPALPKATMSRDAMFSFFRQQFNFNSAQVVALMGAHSLGCARRNESGFSGKWTGANNSGISEIFYKNFLSPGSTWTNVDVSPRNSPDRKWQFNGKLSDGSKGMMLNTDIYLFYNLQLNSVGKATCKVSSTCGLTNSCQGSCPKSSTFDLAQQFASSCQTFMPQFVDAYQKVLSTTPPSSTARLVSTPCCQAKKAGIGRK